MGCKYGGYVPSKYLKAYVFLCNKTGPCPRTKLKKGVSNDEGRMPKAADDN